MSDVEEPPTKMSKYTELQYLEEEALEEGMEEEILEEGQEEWLSEGVLTDNDDHPDAMVHDRSDSNLGNTSQDSQDELETAATHPTAASSTATLPNITDDITSSNIPIQNNVTSIPTNIILPTIEMEHSTAVTDIPTTESLIPTAASEIPTAESGLHTTESEIPTTESGLPTTDSEIPTIKSEVSTNNIPINTSIVSENNETRTESNRIENLGLKDLGINIEETLNNWDGDKSEDIPDNLDAFLIRKTDGKVVEAKVNEQNDDHRIKVEEDDGNDTDELLRMLSEDGVKTKKKPSRIQFEQNTDDSTDDEFLYERSNIQKFKMANNAVIKKMPTKAEPENMSDGDDMDASDEGHTMERMFGMSNKRASFNRSSKSQDKPAAVQKIVKLTQSQKATPKPNQNTNKNSLLKPQSQRISGTIVDSKALKTPTPFKPLPKPTLRKVGDFKWNLKDVTLKKVERGEIIDGEEFLEGERMNLNQEEFEDSDDYSDRSMKIRRPEQMDEECPSDSQSEGGSLYDEVPSSDSEDVDDWFSLDIRAERATDYLPLLGSKAQELLLAERDRVSARVEELRKSLSALTRDSQKQAVELKSAAIALAEIDDSLRTT